MENPNESGINFDLLGQAVQLIKDNPEHWDQNHWHCGTSHCLAGMIHILRNYRHSGLPLDQLLTQVLHDADDEDDGDAVFDAPGYTINGRPTAKIAQEALNISDLQAIWLFAKDRTLQDFETCLRIKFIPRYICYGLMTDYGPYAAEFDAVPF